LPEKKYPDNKSRQAAYRQRLKMKEQENEPKLDYDKVLTDLVTYFEEKTGLKVIAEQRAILEAMANPNEHYIVCSCGRGFSKSLLGIIAALWYADEYSRVMKRSYDIVVISSQRTIYLLLDRVFLEHPELKARLRIEGRSLTIPSENLQFVDTLSTIQRLVPTQNKIRSHRADIIVFDEVAGLSDPIVKTALPLLKENGKVIMLSTPHRERSLFNQYVANTPEGWKLFQFSSDVCYWTEQMRKLCKETLSPEEFEIEINGRVPQEEIKTLFNLKDIESCVESFLNITGLEDTTLHLGVDWGYGANNRSLTVATLSEWKQAYRNIIRTWYWNSDNIETMYEDLASIIKAYNTKTKQLKVQVDSKPPQFASQLKKLVYPIGIIEVDKSALVEGSQTTLKELMLSQTYNLLKTHHLKIPSREEKLIQQLKLYKKDLQYYDDYPDSMMLSVCDLPIKPKATGSIYFPKNMNMKTTKFTPRSRGRGILY
jgi:hypothetical protein